MHWNTLDAIINNFQKMLMDQTISWVNNIRLSMSWHRQVRAMAVKAQHRDECIRVEARADSPRPWLAASSSARTTAPHLVKISIKKCQPPK